MNTITKQSKYTLITIWPEKDKFNSTIEHDCSIETLYHHDNLKGITQKPFYQLIAIYDEKTNELIPIVKNDIFIHTNEKLEVTYDKTNQ